MAKVIEQTGRPALVLAHNKTLAAQLYQEFKTFFPSNAVEYFVSYYDYYQPEAYIPVGRRLHRKRSHHQRRAGQAAPVGHALVVRAPRLRDRRQRQLHLRPGFARSVLRDAADARKRAEDRARGDHFAAGGHPLRAQRWRFQARHVSRARRRHRDCSHLRRLRVSHQLVGRRNRIAGADRSADRPGEADLSAAADLSEDRIT